MCNIKIYLVFLWSFITGYSVLSQSLGNKQEPIVYQSYSIGGIEVTGITNVDKQALILISGLNIGDPVTVPGDKISNAIRQLWKQQLFSDIKIIQDHIEDGRIFLTIEVKELKRMSRFSFDGVTRSEAEDLREDLDLYKERIITDHLLNTAKNKIRSFMKDKGYYNAQVIVKLEDDSLFKNHYFITFKVAKNPRIKIDQILMEGNTFFSDAKLKRQMKETKERSVFAPFHQLSEVFVQGYKSILKKDSISFYNYVADHFTERVRINVFKTSKFLDSQLEDDKKNIIAKYNAQGYRDAKITYDTTYSTSYDGITVRMNIDEGHQYFFRNITWNGNTKYSTKILNQILGIEKGSVYNQQLLDERLFMNANSTDVSSLYMDNGYLFFQITPTEILVENDSIDMEMRVYEGKQARIKNVTVVGNTKTNDHVVLREVRTKPGQLFSRSDIIRTQRELSQLGYFNPEKLNVNPKPNAADGTVDIEYVVEEKPSDQLELSAGWSGYGLVGTLGLTFNNFSTKNINNKNAWTPLPAGDGQRLSVRVQSNGPNYQGYNFSFTEPWLGGKKPNSFTVAAWHNRQATGLKYLRSKVDVSQDSANADGDKVKNTDRRFLFVTSVALSLGTRLKKPDDFFTLLHDITYQHYDIRNWIYFVYSNGTSNNLFYKVVLSRNSIDQPIYPRKGANITTSLQLTPPYSFLREQFLDTTYNYLTMSDDKKYKWTEYYKFKISSEWFTELADKLVLRTKLGFGYLNSYNSQIGTPPFERFYLGGSGLTNFNLDAREIIALRGYDDNSVYSYDKSAKNPYTPTGQPIVNKFTMELRYPLTLNPQATIFLLSFLDAGNTWHKFSQYNPFDLKRSCGVGIRAFLPMFGLLGLDWGYRLDDVNTAPNMQRSQIHFTIGANMGEL